MAPEPVTVLLRRRAVPAPTVTVAVPSAPALVARMLPWAMLILPETVLAPESVSWPEPALVKLEAVLLLVMFELTVALALVLKTNSPPAMLGVSEPAPETVMALSVRIPEVARVKPPRASVCAAEVMRMLEGLELAPSV